MFIFVRQIKCVVLSFVFDSSSQIINIFGLILELRNISVIHNDCRFSIDFDIGEYFQKVRLSHDNVNSHFINTILLNLSFPNYT